jgi:hypothetical protein
LLTFPDAAAEEAGDAVACFCPSASPLLRVEEVGDGGRNCGKAKQSSHGGSLFSVS